MKNGNWVPISKAFVYHLPKDRAYSKVEAAYSLQVDYDKENMVTVAGYADLWRWRRKKVNRFVKAMGIEIIYPEDTKKRRNQRGRLAIKTTHIMTHKATHIRLIDNSDLQTQNTISRPISRPTTRDPKDPRVLTCPCQPIVDFYHDALPELPKVRKLTDKRRRWLNARWNEQHKSKSGLHSGQLEYWVEFFKYVRGSNFLMGRTRGWRADFEWLVKKENFLKVIEGQYHRLV
jgi:hypothetical protein